MEEIFTVTKCGVLRGWMAKYSQKMRENVQKPRDYPQNFWYNTWYNLLATAYFSSGLPLPTRPKGIRLRKREPFANSDTTPYHSIINK